MLKNLPDRLRKQASVIEADGYLTIARLMGEAAHELEIMLDALKTAEKADQKAINCTEHEPDAAPESCEKCFPLTDDARLKRWAALGINNNAAKTMDKIDVNKNRS